MSAILSEMSEVALREVALDFFTDSFSIKKGEKAAKKRINQLMQGSLNLKDHLELGKKVGGLGWQEGLVMAGITGMALAYNAGKEQLEWLGKARLDFDKELLAGNATFLIPSNIERKKLAAEQGGMDAYLQLAEKKAKIFSMLGLKEDRINHRNISIQGTLLSTLPYYKMSRMLPETLSNDSLSEKVRQSISSFLRIQMKTFLDEISDDFEDDIPISDFFVSLWEGDNFLNNYRGRRLIIMTLGNLLWNLLYPIDPETKTRLPIKEQVKLCSEAGEFISELLKKSKDRKHYLEVVDPSGKLTKFVRMTEVYVNELTDAYEDAKNSSLNLDEITTHAHRTARILNNNIFYIIYRSRDKSEALSSHITFLHYILKREPGLLSVLQQPEFKNIKSSIKNDPVPRTIMDLLLVFCQLDDNQSKKFIDTLKGSDKSIRKCFALTLEGLKKNFIDPIYQAEKEDLKFQKYGARKDSYWYNKIRISQDHELRTKARKKTYYQMMSLISMAVNDFNIALDSKEDKEASVRSKLTYKSFSTSREQINKITERSYKNNLKKSERNPNDFGCNLKPFMDLEDETEDRLNELVAKQYKIGQYTHLIATLKNFINKYHGYLLEPKFKEFLQDSLNKINKEFIELDALCQQLKKDINFISTEDRELIGVMRSLENNLSQEITSFVNEVVASTKKLKSAEFENNIKREIMNNIKKISQRFSAAFSDEAPELKKLKDLVKDLKKDLNDPNDEGLTDEEDAAADNEEELEEEILDDVSDVSSIASEPEEEEPQATFYQTHRLSEVMLNCLNAMSDLSKKGIKGDQLSTLYEEFIRKPTCSLSDLTLVARDLSKIVCPYRPTMLFQANYAQGRSAQALVQAIYSSLEDEEFPLYYLLFGEESLQDEIITQSTIERELCVRKDRELMPISIEGYIDSPVIHL